MRPEIVSGIVTAGQLLAHFSPEVLICVRWLEPDFFLFLKWRIEWPHFRIRFHSQTLKNHRCTAKSHLGYNSFDIFYYSC